MRIVVFNSKIMKILPTKFAIFSLLINNLNRFIIYEYILKNRNYFLFSLKFILQ